MNVDESVCLNSGYTIPRLALGTFRAAKEAVSEAVELALSVGYRHIDCSMVHDNEKEVGEAIARSMERLNLRREDIFVAAKFSCDKHAPEDVRKVCESSLKDLGLEYLDLYLVHFPMSPKTREDEPLSIYDPVSGDFERRKLEETWKATEELVSAGLVRSIGVCNFVIRQLRWLLDRCTIPPAVNQVEVNVYYPNTRLIRFCRSRRIVVEGCAPLGSPCFMRFNPYKLLQNDDIVKVAHDYKKTPAQVVLRHSLQRGIVIILRSVIPERIKSCFDVFDFDLSHMDVLRVDNAPWNVPLSRVSALAKDPEYPFHDDY
ncbi:Aldo-keto reductase family 1 member A1-A [Taenia crassiceps]|uniref:Aldo-keto reductase family 1 member A1-A n=1 Tax=Taenia crassiceps TaxID=6207 RepID=A0ABR4QAA3_9CEST